MKRWDEVEDETVDWRELHWGWFVDELPRVRVCVRRDDQGAWAVHVVVGSAKMVVMRSSSWRRCMSLATGDPTYRDETVPPVVTWVA